MITVTAGILFRDSKVFIAKRKATGRLPGKWEFPGGKVEPGETPEEGLRRELREELHIDAAIGENLWESRHKYDFGEVQLLFYQVYWDSGDVVSRDHDEYAWVTVDQLGGYDFAPADWPFVEKLINGKFAPAET